MSAAAIVIAVILAQTELLVWLEALCRRAIRSVEASLNHIEARLGVIEARFAAWDAQRNGGYVAVYHPRLIEMRQ
jgi:hypothetical protein